MVQSNTILDYTETTKQSCSFLILGIASISIYLLIQNSIPYFVNILSKFGIICILLYAVYIIFNGTYPICNEYKMTIFDTKHIYLQRTIIQNMLLSTAIFALIYFFI